MSVGLRLDLRQSQQLVMTPQLQQAIKLLQMSNLELTAFVEVELEKNPLLKPEAEIADQIPDPTEGPSEAPAAPAVLEATDQRTEDHNLSEDTFDTGRENLNDTSPSDGPHGGTDFGQLGGSGKSSGDFEDMPSWSERLAEQVSLRDHLHAQLGQSRAPRDVMLVARYLTDELDEHGYLRADMDEAAERLSVSRPLIDAALDILQSCEPTGVGARTLGECLGLQLRDAGELDPAMARLLDNLELLARNERRKLCNLCGVDEAGLGALVQRLRLADPRPCARFDMHEAEPLVPDVLLKRTNWGGWHIELNPDTLPRVLLDRTYIAELGRQDCAQARQFLSDCRSNASWLIKSLDQRAKTIVKIASEIVRRQEDFFAKGISGLRPLTLRDVADAVGMHESTASRVTANKYMSTERGIFELKFFFTNAVGGGDGDIAAEAVRHRIKAMVSGEQAGAVLSDDAIVDALASEGIEIARRTVAKYRGSLNIPSSVERRRQQAMRVQA